MENLNCTKIHFLSRRFIICKSIYFFVFRFEIAVIYLGVVISLQAYGHVTMDCTIAAFYAYAQTQLKILRYNIEHLFDEYQVQGTYFIYFVDNDTELRRILSKKIVSCIKHYEQIVWLVFAIIFLKELISNYLFIGGIRASAANCIY